ncbi:MAG TPA: Holliday junction resolvase RuvX [Candidatus Paceibacterota bacterium]
MRYLGIDYGSKRVGVAISDESARFAFPERVISNDKNLIDAIETLAREHNITHIIIGESRKYDMTANPIQEDIIDFKEHLEGRGFAVILELEFMTSQQAEREQGKHAKIDASAAALILQSYLDKQSAQSA